MIATSVSPFIDKIGCLQGNASAFVDIIKSGKTGFIIGSRGMTSRVKKDMREIGVDGRFVFNYVLKEKGVFSHDKRSGDLESFG